MEAHFPAVWCYLFRDVLRCVIKKQEGLWEKKTLGKKMLISLRLLKNKTKLEKMG
jgi:hypothetical protein